MPLFNAVFCLTALFWPGAHKTFTMNKYGFLLILLISLTIIGNAQTRDLLKPGRNRDSLSSNDVCIGIKEVLNNGITKGTGKLSAVDGF